VHQDQLVHAAYSAKTLEQVVQAVLHLGLSLYRAAAIVKKLVENGETISAIFFTRPEIVNHVDNILVSAASKPRGVLQKKIHELIEAQDISLARELIVDSAVNGIQSLHSSRFLSALIIRHGAPFPGPT
jgi:hypothetical protein